MNKLNFELQSADPENQKFSLKMENSDYMRNQGVLNALIATLVKYGPSGRIEPYLSESWQTSKDQRTWEFTLKKEITCEDNSIISAKSFSASLHQTFKHLSAKNIITFNNLLGWEKFITNQTNHIEGIIVDESKNSIRFEFNQSTPDLLNYLRMPYFGHWCGTPDYKLSSGPYRVINYDSQDEYKIVHLKYRENSGYDYPEFQEIIFKFVPFNSNPIFEVPTISNPPKIFTPINTQLTYTIESPPEMLQAFVLNSKSGIFKNKALRQHFTEKAREILYRSEKLSNFFIGENVVSTVHIPNEFPKIDRKELSGQRIKITLGPSPTKHTIDKFGAFFDELLNPFGLSKEIVNLPIDKKYLGYDQADISIISVNNGALPNNSVIEMMFCSELGVRFPDPSGRICKLVNKYKAKNSPADEQYSQEFNQILKDDAVIIPVDHLSDKYYVSKSIDPKSIPPTTVYPLFEKIRMQK